jgi:hypothetical protein
MIIPFNDSVEPGLEGRAQCRDPHALRGEKLPGKIRLGDEMAGVKCANGRRDCVEP